MGGCVWIDDDGFGWCLRPSHGSYSGKQKQQSRSGEERDRATVRLAPKSVTANNSDISKGMVTEHPLPGLKVSNGECTPADKAAVLNAATPSRAWADNVGELHWVRGQR